MANDSATSAGIVVGYPYQEALQMLKEAKGLTGYIEIDDIEADGLLKVWFPEMDAELEDCIVGVGVEVTPIVSYEVIPDPAYLITLIHTTREKLLELYPKSNPKVYLTTFW